MAEQAAANATGGFKWDDLTKMLSGFMKKPENQRMIMEMIEPMTQVYDPRTGKMVGGVGTGMLEAGSNLINREEVGKAAEAQALREQLYQKQRLAQQQDILKLLSGQSQEQMPAGPYNTGATTSQTPKADPWTSMNWLRTKGIGDY